MELATHGQELVTREFEIVTLGFKVVTCGFELVTRLLKLELVTCNLQLVFYFSTALYCIKKLSAFLRGTISKHDGDFYCLNSLHSFGTENKLKSHEKVCKNKNFCGSLMPSEKNNILEFN